MRAVAFYALCLMAGQPRARKRMQELGWRPAPDEDVFIVLPPLPVVCFFFLVCALCVFMIMT